MNLFAKIKESTVTNINIHNCKSNYIFFSLISNHIVKIIVHYSQILSILCV